jgi:biopolymer transport protein ExbB/TolQ
MMDGISEALVAVGLLVAIPAVNRVQRVRRAREEDDRERRRDRAHATRRYQGSPAGCVAAA